MIRMSSGIRAIRVIRSQNSSVGGMGLSLTWHGERFSDDAIQVIHSYVISLTIDRHRIRGVPLSGSFRAN